MKENILEFLSIYQFMLYAQTRRIFGSLEDNEIEDYGPITLNYFLERLISGSNTSIFQSLIFNSNLNESPQILSHFAFLSKPLDHAEFYFFGKDTMYNFYIGSSKKTGIIVLYDWVQQAYRIIARDELSFLRYLTSYLEYTLVTEYSGQNDGLNKTFRSKCIGLVGAVESEVYYRLIFPLESEYKEEKILEFPNKLILLEK